MGNFTDRLQHAWNAFMNKDPTSIKNFNEVSYGWYRPDRPHFTRGNERSIVNAIYNRMALDAAAVDIKHVRLDQNGNYVELIDSGLNECLSVSANIDQTGRALVQDIVMSLLDEGCIAVVPTDTKIDPKKSATLDIEKLRVGHIVSWYPDSVKMEVYNEKTGRREQIALPKSSVCIIENPFFSVMNESNSTMQRLIRKLNLLDAIDEQSGAGKLDLIIQLPYITKTEAKKQQAENRRKSIEDQLANSKYGIAYTDATEHVTQLNRSLDNNLMNQIQYLTDQLFSQLGITTEILNGTANDSVMNNYYSRTIEPILSAITDEMKRKFLSKTARSQRQSIEFYRDPFKLVPVTQIAEIADKFTRNEIMTSNELRQIVGMRPSEDPGANELRNKNLSPSKDDYHIDVDGQPIPEENMQMVADGEGQEAMVDRLLEELKLRRKNQNGV